MKPDKTIVSNLLKSYGTSAALKYINQCLYPNRVNATVATNLLKSYGVSTALRYINQNLYPSKDTPAGQRPSAPGIDRGSRLRNTAHRTRARARVATPTAIRSKTQTKRRR